MHEYLMVTTACLDKNVPAMYDLLRQFMTETNWDNENKLDSLIKNSASGVVNSIANAGSKFARLYASSMLTPAKVCSFLCRRCDRIGGGRTHGRTVSNPFVMSNG